MVIEAQLTLVESTEEVNDFLRWLGERRPVLGLDTETSGLSLATDRIRLVQFGDAQHGWAIPYLEWRGLIREVLQKYEGPLVLHHAKFDAAFLQRDGLPFPWAQAHDTMIMSFLINSLGPKGLKGAAALYVDPQARAGEARLKKAMTKNRWTYGTIPIDFPAFWGYAALDAVITARLAEKLWPRIQDARQAYDLELACERVLCEMELRGVRIDVDYCRLRQRELQTRLQDLQQMLGDLNYAAPAQVVKALQDEGAELTKRTDAGQLSVDDEVLRSLASTSVTAAHVLEARSTNKLLSAYFDNFLEFNANGIVHPHINQLAARTGRMSVTEPALQQVPRSALVRDAFVPRDGNKLVLVDYSNQELRVTAHYSGDQAMIKAFAEGRDLHGETARRLYGEGFTREQRTIAKTAMFSKAYGAGIDKFALTSGVSMREAKAVFSALSQLYPGMDEMMAKVTRTVRGRSAGDRPGYVQLQDGRKLRVRADKAYIGTNALVQGTCAVVLKRALVDLDAAGLGEYLVLPIHDEVIFDVPEETLDDVIPAIHKTMTREDFRVPLTVGSKTVARWGDAYKEG